MDSITQTLKRIPPGPVLAAMAVAALALMASQPNALARVPDLEGKRLHDAQSEAATAGFTTRVVLKTGPGAAGTVLEQQPESQELLARRSPVVLTVTKGARQVGVPDVRGMPVAEARRVLRDADLVPGDVTYRPRPDRESNRVYATDPPAGATVDAGTAVHVYAAA